MGCGGIYVSYNLVPSSVWQFFIRMHSFLPHGDKFCVGLAVVLWATWNCRNKVTFEKYVMHSPFEIVFAACSFLLSWAGLQKPVDAELL